MVSIVKLLDHQAMFIRVQKLKSPFDIIQSDTMIAILGMFVRIEMIGHTEVKPAVVGYQAYCYYRVGHIPCAMFEGIFHKRDEQHRLDALLR